MTLNIGRAGGIRAAKNGGRVTGRQVRTAVRKAGSADLIRQIESLKMIPVSEGASIMRDEVTVGLFRQVMKGYAIKGHNVHWLKTVLDDASKQSDPLTYVSLFDARVFAERLWDLTERKFRVQTEPEWQQARDQLTGSNWTWTKTKYSGNSFVLRQLHNTSRGINGPRVRYEFIAVRLVEDLK